MNGNERSVQKMNGIEGNVLNGIERDAQPCKNMKKTRVKKFCDTVPLKGQCHEIFDPYFFHLNYSIWVPDRHAKTVFNSFLISRRYSLK